ncbi:hypothetical protein [Oceanobacillus jordanicus]|uniref:Lipoprotein n=1 Tax=Oceanobacillus jordanicus TaxID=2867266 RepID=A0AAW5B8V5_9BACI|nr:hypothetical protein [Oceanobacillus jordanicus]MCG3419816.1 hypothetical protein [Oceanobacillus jordanicus]
MRFLITLFLLSFLVAVSGCSNGESTHQPDQEREPILIKENQFGLGTEGGGKFYRYKKIEVDGTYETGPVVVHLESAELVRGSFNEDHSEVYNIKANETLEMINFHVKFELNSKIDNFTFNEKYLHLVTENDEKVEKPNELLSSVVHESFLKSPEDNSERFLRQFSFRLEENNVEEIKKATLIIDPSVDNSGDPLGEKLEIEVDFFKSEDQ